MILKYGDLSDLLKSIKTNLKENFTNDFVKMRWSLELMRGLAFIHSKHVAHRDLKPSNVFLCENAVEENFDQNWRFRFEQRHGACVVFEVVCGHIPLSKSASYSRRSSYKQD